MSSTKVKSIRIDNDLYEQLKLYSASNKISLSETIRRFASKGLSVHSYVEQQDEIRRYIAETIEDFAMKHMDRLIRLQLKSTRFSVAAFYAIIMMVDDSYIDDDSVESAVARALQLAAKEMRQKEESIEEYIKEASNMLEAIRNTQDLDNFS